MKDRVPRAAHTRPERASFRLSGRSVKLDNRIHAIRADLADVSLAGILFSAHYARAVEMQCVVSGTPVLNASNRGAEAVSQLLRGESFHVLDVTSEWSWGFCEHDGYVGYVRRDSIDLPETRTHRITALLAPVFSRPDIKSAVLDHLPAAAQFAGVPQDGFIACAEGFVHHRHAAELSALESDWVAVAQQYIGQPYLWGGRGHGGVDCSGLVQAALGRCGIAVPRDTDMQAIGIGNPLPEDAALRRGDFVFFPGHVGVMVDGVHMLHANAHWMSVMIEPLADVIDRLKPIYEQPVTARRRIGQ